MPVNNELFVLIVPRWTFAQSWPQLDESEVFTPDGGASSLAVTNATVSGTTVTLTVASTTGLSTGMHISVSGVQGMSGVNGNFAITALTSTTIRYTATASGTYSSGGTVNNGSAIPRSTVVGEAIMQKDMLAINQGVVEPPSLTGFTPDHCNGGDPGFTLVLTGSGFSTSAEVHFGPYSAAATFISSTSLNAAITAAMVAVAGSYPVWVSDLGGDSNAIGFYVAGAGGGGAGYYAF